MPGFPPLFPDVEWWRLYLEGRLLGRAEEAAVIAANEACGLKPRGWMRFEVAGPATLTLPVSGGASALKNRPASTWRLAAEAEREWRKIMATIATLYGRFPYFDEVFALLDDIRRSSLISASELNLAAFRAVVRFLHLEELLPQLGNAICNNADGSASMDRERLEHISREAESRIDASLSITDTLMRLGPDAIFTLLPPF